jgi:ABC-type Mn2+/Zn2+ transport system permease subunit
VGGLVLGWTFDVPVGAMTVIIAAIVCLAVSVCRVLVKRK